MDDGPRLGYGTAVRLRSPSLYMTPLAVIDIGSNSICMLVAARRRDGTLVPIDKVKDAARLRDAVGADGNLSPDGLARTMAALANFRQVLDNWGVPASNLRCVATAALRAANNRDMLVRRAQMELGLRVEVIPGVEEARLAYLGVLGGMPEAHGQRLLCVDVGGGSTELLLGRAGETLAAVSVPVGALVVTRQWLGPDPVGPQKAERARDMLRRILAEAIEPLHEAANHIAAVQGGVATSGTIQRVVRLARAATGTFKQDVHGEVLTRDELAQVVHQLEDAESNERRLLIPGMDASRSDILLGGALIYEVLADLLDLQAWTVSMDGLRMGVLHDLAKTVP